MKRHVESAFQRLRRRAWPTLVGALCLTAGTAVAGVTNDRLYLLGDDEGGVAGEPAGVPIEGDLITYDSAGESGVGNYQDLFVFGSPDYVDVSDRPGAAPGDIGIAFDAANSDYLLAVNLNNPANSQSAIGSNDVGEPGPLNYNGISDRGFQFWVKPSSAGAGNAQQVVNDADQHGVLISADDTWVMRYNGSDTDSGVPVAFDQWHHVMLVRPSITAGSQLYVDGVAVASRGGGYNGNSIVPLTVGANTGGIFDLDSQFTGGTEQFFTGAIDDLEMFVMGDNSNNPGPPQGQDWGTYDFATDNAYAAGVLTGVAGDVNQDGVLTSADVDDFIAGWLSENIPAGEQRAGDILSIRNGDLNFDGITDLKDVFLMHEALSGAGMPADVLANLTVAPEPGTGAAIGVLGLLLFRRRSR